MQSVFHRLEVFRGRSPAPVGVEEVFAGDSVERIVGDGVLFESAFISDSSATIPQVQLSCGAITNRAHVIFFAQGWHQRRELNIRVDLTQQFLNYLLAF